MAKRETQHDRASTPVDETRDSLVARAQQIDPRRATCCMGHYGEDFELEDGSIRRVLSSGLIWTNGQDAVPDWAMREAWTEFRSDWERLQATAWERDRRHTVPTLANPKVKAILQLEPTPSDLIDALYRVFSSKRPSDLTS